MKARLQVTEPLGDICVGVLVGETIDDLVGRVFAVRGFDILGLHRINEMAFNISQYVPFFVGGEPADNECENTHVIRWEGDLNVVAYVTHRDINWQVRVIDGVVNGNPELLGGILGTLDLAETVFVHFALCCVIHRGGGVGVNFPRDRPSPRNRPRPLVTPFRPETPPPLRAGVARVPQPQPPISFYGCVAAMPVGFVWPMCYSRVPETRR